MANILAGFNLDTSHIGDSIIDFARLAESQRQHNNQQKMQRDRDEYNVIKDLSNYQPTGTVYDDIAAPMAQSLTNKYIQLGEKNPRMSRNEKLKAIYPEVAQLARWSNTAKQIADEQKQFESVLDKEHPWIDRNKAIALARKNAFFDAEGNKLTVPNRNWQYDINDINIAKQISNAEAIPEMETKAMKSAYQPSESIFSGDGINNPDKVYSAYPYQRYNPQTNTVDVVGGKVNAAGTFFDVADESVNQYIPKGTRTKIALNSIKDELSQNPKFSELSPYEQDLAANYQYLKRYGQSEKTGWENDNYNQINENRRARNEGRAIRQQDIQNAIQQERLSLEKQRYNLSEQKYKEKKQSLGDYKVIADMVTDAPIDETGQVRKQKMRLASPVDELLTVAATQVLPASQRMTYMNLPKEKLNKFVQVYDVSMGTKNKHVQDANGNNIKLYFVQSPDGKSKSMIGMKTYKEKGNYYPADRNENGEYVNPYFIVKDPTQMLSQISNDYLKGQDADEEFDEVIAPQIYNYNAE